jgi:hypothetical protein
MKRVAKLMLAGLVLAPTVRADAVRNGNEVALAYVEADEEAKVRLRDEHLGVIHTFRYLEVTRAAEQLDEGPGLRVVTVEPGSDMSVVLLVSGKVSLTLARALAVGECVAVKGRIKALGEPEHDTIVVEPAVLKHKDRCAPKTGKELRREVDPSAH